MPQKVYGGAVKPARNDTQVAGLRHQCLRQILANITTGNILEYVQVADSVSDTVLMDTCLRLWAQPDFR